MSKASESEIDYTNNSQLWKEFGELLEEMEMNLKNGLQKNENTEEDRENEEWGEWGEGWEEMWKQRKDQESWGSQGLENSQWNFGDSYCEEDNWEWESPPSPPSPLLLWPKRKIPSWVEIYRNHRDRIPPMYVDIKGYGSMKLEFLLSYTTKILEKDPYINQGLSKEIKINMIRALQSLDRRLIWGLISDSVWMDETLETFETF